jgi:hypothetical protein
MVESARSQKREAPFSGGEPLHREVRGLAFPSAMARRIAVISLLALAAPLTAATPAPPAPPPPGEGVVYTRPLAVTAPGWVRVPLDLTTLRHLASGSSPGGDLRVLAPSGLPVPSRVAPSLPGGAAEKEGTEGAPEASLTVTSREADCSHPAAAETVCRLVLPAAGQVIGRLTFDLEGRGDIGYRVYEPRDSRWRLLAEGVWPAGPAGAERALTLPPDPVTGDVLRLELYGGGGAGPALRSFRTELAAETVLFYAEQPGSYTLAYGGGGVGAAPRGRPAQRSAATPESPGMVAWLSPGAEEEHPPPGLPAAAVEPGNPLGEVRFAISWKLAAPEARPGTLVRLEVPPEVYGPARADLADLRLAVGDRQIPYLRWTPPAPTLVRETRVEPQRVLARRDQGGLSRVDLALPQTGLPLTQLLLSAPPLPLARGLSVRYVEPARPGVEAGERLAAREVWECSPRPPLPCRVLLPLTGRAPRLLALRFEDRDNPPLGSLDLSLWRRSDVLVFVWPEHGEVHLLAGARNLKAPDYDLAALGDQLLAFPWRPAELAPSEAATPAPRWARWVMPATLALAALLLLVLLRRAIKTA